MKTIARLKSAFAINRNRLWIKRLVNNLFLFIGKSWLSRAIVFKNETSSNLKKYIKGDFNLGKGCNLFFNSFWRKLKVSVYEYKYIDWKNVKWINYGDFFYKRHKTRFLMWIRTNLYINKSINWFVLLLVLFLNIFEDLYSYMVLGWSGFVFQCIDLQKYKKTKLINNKFKINLVFLIIRKGNKLYNISKLYLKKKIYISNLWSLFKFKIGLSLSLNAGYSWVLLRYKLFSFSTLFRKRNHKNRRLKFVFYNFNMRGVFKFKSRYKYKNNAKLSFKFLRQKRDLKWFEKKKFFIGKNQWDWNDTGRVLGIFWNSGACGIRRPIQDYGVNFYINKETWRFSKSEHLIFFFDSLSKSRCINNWHLSFGFKRFIPEK